jgi:hypothetical protein
MGSKNLIMHGPAWSVQPISTAAADTLHDAAWDQVFPVILDEFGSTLGNNAEKACFQSIVSYANNSGEAQDRQHADIDSWFYW